jgi:hypothetical protein
VAIVVALALFAAAAKANNIFDGHNTCTTLNCGSLLIEGRVLTYRAGDGAGAPTDPLPWSAMVYADAGECLRLHVVDESADLAMVVTDSRGDAVYRSDDPGGVCPLCPIVKIDPAAWGGWLAVVISSPLVIPTDVSFKLRIGRYNGGNPNCAGPTPPE